MSRAYVAIGAAVLFAVPAALFAGAVYLRATFWSLEAEVQLGIYMLARVYFEAVAVGVACAGVAGWTASRSGVRPPWALLLGAVVGMAIFGVVFLAELVG